MTTSDQLRILTALAVLRSKPSDQTLFSYIQLLKDIFPLTKAQPSSANAIPIAASTHEHAWKAHAQRLEAECTALKARVAHLETRNLVHSTRNLVHSTLVDEANAGLNSQNTTAKKKSKKNAQLVAQGVTPTGTELTASAHNHTSNTLLFALSKFSQLSQSPSDSISPTTLLSITQKLFTGLSEALLLATTLTNRQAFAKVHTDLYAVLSSIFTVSAQIQTVSNVRNNDAHLDPYSVNAQPTIAPILDQLLTSFLVPLTSQFLSSTLALLTNALDPPPSARGASSLATGLPAATPSQPTRPQASQAPSQKPSQAPSAPSPPFDPRPSLLALFQAALTHTHTSLSVSFPKEAQTETINGLTIFLRALILELVRQVYGMLKLPAAAAAYVTPQPDITSLSTSKPKLSRQQRLHRLAVKDTFWYLSSAIHFVLDVHDRICGSEDTSTSCSGPYSGRPATTTTELDSDSTTACDPKPQPKETSNTPFSSTKTTTIRARLTLLTHSTLTDLAALLLYQDRARAVAYTSYTRVHMTTQNGVPGSAGSGVVKDGSGGVRDGGTTTTTTTRKVQSQAHPHTSSDALSNPTNKITLSTKHTSTHQPQTRTQSKDNDNDPTAPSNCSTKRILSATSAPSAAAPPSIASPNDEFYTLDDMEYRVFLRLVERLGCLGVR